MATIRDVAKLAGVSPITVSRVINNSGYVSSDTRVRVEEAIAQLEYIPNSLSTSLRFKKSNIVALLVSDITNPFWTTVARGVEDVCHTRNLSVILCNTDEKQDKLDNYVNVLMQRQIDGFLLVPTSDDTQLLHRIQKKGIPLVVVDRQVPSVQVDMVRCDSEGGAFQLVNYLISLGHRRIGVIGGPPNISTSQQRIAGWHHALTQAGIPIDESLVVYGGYRQQTGYQMARHILDRLSPRPTAIFATNNFIAIGTLQAISEMGLRVPEDISVVAFDDLTYSMIPEPFLTVVAQAPYQIGIKAAQLLIDQITRGSTSETHEIVLPVELIIRKSCKAVE